MMPGTVHETRANCATQKKSLFARQMMHRRWVFWLSVGVTLALCGTAGWVVRAQTPELPLEGKVESSTDDVPPQYRLGRDLYAQNCGSCHLLIPVEVFPDATWRELLLNSYHYGKQVEVSSGPTRILLWQYLRDYSRGLEPKEPVPLFFSESRYFKALHPKVALPKPLKAGTCIGCHPSATGGNFRKLTAEWESL